MDPNTCKRSTSNEDLAESSSKRIKTNEDEKSEDSYLAELLTGVLEVMKSVKKVQDGDIESAKGFIIGTFREQKFFSVDLAKWENSCAYLSRFGTHGAALTRCKTLNAIEKCESFASKLRQNDLNIISLGGGPGNDVIGLCSALYENQVRFHTMQCSRLNITATDYYQEWSPYVELVKFFIMEGSYGNVSNLFRQNDVNLSFLCAKLPGNPSQDKKYFRILREADIVLMAKLMSIVKSEDKEIVKSIYENMKQGAYLLFIDSPFKEKLWNDFEVMYYEEGESQYYPSFRSVMFDSVTSKAGVAVLRKN